ncbi:MAG TPA: protein kinase, partial [Gemmataceae bacterium]|nr:protein kinase [Gemmataceae bacterium]
MSQSKTLHPPADRLAAYRSGRLAPDEVRTIAEHLAACPACRELLGPADQDTIPPVAHPADATVAGKAPENPYALPQAIDAPTVGYGAAAAPGGEAPAALADHPRYRVLQLLGSGGMGSVYKAEHRVMERLVALKVLNPELIRNSAALQRFLQEVRTAAKLLHPNIVTAHDADQAGDVHFLVMEYVEGVSLAELVQKRGRMPIARACECVRQAALGLQHAFEKGMVHRDIKPQNLMLSAQGRIKILDFGLARFAMETAGTAPLPPPGKGNQGGLTLAGSIMGTPDYMAPEQAADARQADIRADIYSLGCTLYDLLTGQPPFPEGTIIQKVMAHHERLPRPLADFRADVPRELAAVLARMMAKNPAERYQTPIEVVRALAVFVKPAAAPGKEAPPDVPVSAADSARTRTAKAASPAASPSMEKELIAIAKEESRRPRPVSARRPTKRRRQLWYLKRPVWLAGAAAGFLLIVLTVLVLGGRRTPPPTPKATLTLQAEGNNAAVLVTEDGQRVARLDPILVPSIELETGRRYHLELEGAPDGVTLSWKTVTLLPGDAVVVKTQRPPPPVDDTAKLAKNSEALGPRPEAPSAREPTEELKFVGHRAHLAGGVFCTDGRQVLTWSAETLYLFDATNANLLRTFEGHSGEVLGAAFYPDGKHFLSCSFDGTVRLWDIQAPKPLATLPGPNLGRLRCVALSPDGALAAAAGEGQDHRIMLWNAATLAPLGTLNGHKEGVVKIAFSPPNGRYLYSASWDGTLGVWDVPQLKQTKAIEHGSAVQSLALSRDGHFLLSGTRGGVLRLWNTSSGEKAHESEPLGCIVDGVAFSPSGHYALIVGGGTGSPNGWVPGEFGLMRYWDLRDWKEVWKHDLDSGPIFGVSLSENGQNALTSHWDHVARLWKLPEPGKSATSSSAVQVANGQLLIESEEPSVAVVVKRDGKIVSGPTTERTIPLRPGNYEIDWAEPQGLLRFSTEKFDLPPGGQKIIKIRRVQLAWPGRTPAPDLSGITPIFEDKFTNPKSGFGVKKDQPDKNLTMTLGYARDHYAIDFRMRT